MVEEKKDNMGLLGRIRYKIRVKYYEFMSLSKKRLFEEDKEKTYQYMDEIFCHDKNVFEEIVIKNKKNVNEYWAKENFFSVEKYFPQTYIAAKTLLMDRFLPLFKFKPEILDIGCASGEWTLLASTMCEKIVGYEFSQKMVDTAKKEAQKRGTYNVEFYQADARALQINKEYDGAMIFAVLMYFCEEEDIVRILKNVFDHLKPGGFLCTRDSLNNDNRDLILMYNIKSGYSGFYWSKQKYYELFNKAGFVLREEIVLDEVTSRRIGFLHIGNIWQKPLN